ncbi:uncharacterized protein LOC123551531 [Mercenaria mercenaria]|uniref:uncharacterized protein LOC123551531 n=1 Tax=Mercenaria mercenaria TaxID=6596 RepID=UPI00234E790B|nr:uncharacterized protein LOC123551531 [Mercenaria mercenaria]XP_045196477.2 uncharacterized protein LOC123551531 [Mercenaria mercenaria]
MSWGSFFDQSGSYAAQTDSSQSGGYSSFEDNTYYDDSQGGTPSLLQTSGYKAESNYGQVKRAMPADDGYGFKRTKADSYASGGFDEGPTSWDMMKEPEPEPVSMSWENMSELTSWDQLSAGKPSGGAGAGGRGGAGRGARGRGGGGRGAGGRGGTGGGGSGQFGGGGGAKSQAGSGYGGGYGKGGGAGGGGGRGGGYGGGRGGGGNNRGTGGGGGYGGGNRGSGGGYGGSSRGGGRGGGGGYRGGGSGGGWVDRSHLSLVEKFEKFSAFLRGDTARVNSIQSIENACMCTGMNLRCEYSCEELPRIYNRLLFTGRLSISGIFLTRTVGMNKKDMKHEVYNKAHEVLTTKTVADINDLKDPGVETVRTCIERLLKKSGPGQYQEGMGVPMNQAVGDIVNEIKSNLDAVRGLQTGLGKLIAYLKGPTKMPDNPISKIEQAMMASHCGIRHIFQIETREEGGKPMFDGEFILEDTCIARASDSNKKTCKTNTYIAAFEALMMKPIAEILIPVTKEEELKEDDHVQNEAIVAGVGQVDGEGPPPVVKPSLREASLPERLRNLNSVLSASAFSDHNISILDNCIHNSGLTGMCIYRRTDVASDDCASCEFYIENYLIAIGHGSTKSDCTNEVYDIAWDIITTSSPEDIMQNCRKIEAKETTGPTVLDVVVKGEKGSNRESNIAQLRRHGYDPDDTSRTIGDLIIVEAGTWHEDRRTFAFAILQNSALHNGMQLQWCFTPIKPHGRTNYKHEHRPLAKFRCQMFLQGQQVSEHTGHGKNKTRNFAAVDILFHLYEKNDVVRIMKLTDEKRWIPYTTIQQEAMSLRKAAKDSMPTPPKDILDRRPADKHIVNAIRNRIDKFFPRNDAEELLIGPGIPDAERGEIRAYVQSLGLRMDQRQRDGNTYFVIYSKQDMRNVVAALKRMGGNQMYGKYKLIPRSECPKHSDVLKSTNIELEVKFIALSDVVNMNIVSH